ncbi:hypothetical protein ACQW5G_07040 [Fructilactobacillus sp. Tb1]
MTQDVLINWLFLLLAISTTPYVIRFMNWYDNRQSEKETRQNKRRGNHFI